MKKSLLIIFVVFLILGCKKDWGIQFSERYQSVDGPEQFWNTNLKINLTSSKQCINLNEGCNIEAVVQQIKTKENGDTVSIVILQPSNFLFKWEIFDFEAGYRYLVDQLRNGFRINNRNQLEAIGINKIVFSTLDYNTMESYYMSSSSRLTIDDILIRIKKIFIKCTVRDVNNQQNSFNDVIGIDFER